MIFHTIFYKPCKGGGEDKKEAFIGHSKAKTTHPQHRNNTTDNPAFSKPIMPQPAAVILEKHAQIADAVF